jgi:hypothetical protein
MWSLSLGIIESDFRLDMRSVGRTADAVCKMAGLVARFGKAIG